MGIKKCLAILFVLVLALAAVAQTADELYNKAVNKYFLGDETAAVQLLRQALEIDPNNSKARGLLNEIRGASAPAVSPTLPAPSPRPAVRRPAEPKSAPPRVMLPKPVGNNLADLEGPINQILLLLLAVIVFAVALAVRGAYFVVRDAIARARRQTCPDCKTKNPEQAEFCAVCGTRLKAWSGVTSSQKKWFAKFGWKQNPFALTVIPGLFTGYSTQVNAIMEKINTRSGHILVYGDKGVGKTTLLRWLADNLKQDNHAIYIARPPVYFEDLLKLIVQELKGSFIAGRKKYTLYEIEGLVKKAKKPVVLLLDEAHEFSAEVEQQMRSLGDIPNVNYVLAGLPEAREKIKHDSPPFFDRIVLESYIDHLTTQETKEMIQRRIESIGGKGLKPFTDAALENVFKMSKGRPRMVLKVCDWVMTDAIRNNLDVIGEQSGQDFPVEKAHEVEEQREEKKN